MNQNVGAIIAIVFLVIGNIAFGMLFYGNMLEKESYREALRLAPKKELADKWGNKNMRKIDEEMLALNEANESLQTKLNETEAALAEERDKLAAEKELNQGYQQDMKKLQEINETKTEAEKRVRDELVALQEKMNEPDTHKDQLKEQRDEAKNQAEEHMRELMRVKEGWLAAQERFRGEKNRLIRETEKLREALDKLRHGGEVVEGYKRTATEYDGKILEVDVDRRFAVIDAGRVHRIRRGMKFSVVRVRYGREETMGRIEVTEVFPSTAAVTILSGATQKRVCPQCGFEGHEGMRYCPYCSEGEGNDRTVALLGQGVAEKSSMDPLDPILPGDRIQNAVYNREETLAFAIAGEPQQFTGEELRTLIEEDYGGEVKDEVDVETDYLVLCRVPEGAGGAGEKQLERIQAVKRARERAKQFGVPIMREVELLNLLRN